MFCWSDSKRQKTNRICVCLYVCALAQLHNPNIKPPAHDCSHVIAELVIWCNCNRRTKSPRYHWYSGLDLIFQLPFTWTLSAEKFSLQHNMKQFKIHFSLSLFLSSIRTFVRTMAMQAIPCIVTLKKFPPMTFVYEKLLKGSCLQ